jgi:NitT/TauT family transport system substrate-binding protein
MPEMTTVRLRLLWFPQAQFAGPLLAQHRGIAAAHGIDLQCVPVDFTLGPIDAVLSGDCDLAIASPAHLVESKAPAELLLLLAAQQASSLVYGARRAAGIAGFADLRGKRIAVWPGGEDLELRWALRRSGVADAEVTFVPVNDTASALASGDVDAAQLTTYHEIFELEHHVHDLSPFVLLKAADAGAGLLKDGLIARRDWIDRHADLAQAVIDSVLAGWTAAFTDPAGALALCEELRPDLSRDHHERQLAAIRALSLTGATLTDGLGFPDPHHLRDAVTAMRETHGHEISLGADGGLDRRFWDAAPAASRATRW